MDKKVGIWRLVCPAASLCFLNQEVKDQNVPINIICKVGIGRLVCLSSFLYFLNNMSKLKKFSIWRLMCLSDFFLSYEEEGKKY